MSVPGEINDLLAMFTVERTLLVRPEDVDRARAMVGRIGLPGMRITVASSRQVPEGQWFLMDESAARI